MQKSDGVIQVFVPGLPDTPGWVALSRKKQDQLLEHTSHIQQNRQLQVLGEFGELMELYRQGRIRPMVTERFPLARGGEAIARLGARATRGKLVVVMG